MAINFLGNNPITALVLIAVLNGIVAAPLIVLVMLVSNSRTAMGERTNGRLLNVVGWVTAIVMGAAAIGLIVTSILGYSFSSSAGTASRPRAIRAQLRAG